MSPRGERRAPVVATVAVAAALLAAQLLVPPILGLADNGDFGRVMAKVGLGYIGTTREDNYVNWALTKFALVQKARPADPTSVYLTSETPVAALAVLASRVFGDGAVFDIRFLGVLHALLLLAALGVLVAACRDLSAPTQWLVAALLVFIFSDVGYAAPLNSLYAQTASFLFFLLTAAAAAAGISRGGLDGAHLFAYFGLAAMFVASKPQEAVHGPLLAAFGLSLALSGARRSRRWLAAALALCLFAFSVWCFRSTPDWLRRVALYNTLFRELLPSSPDPAADLRHLGLDPGLVRHANTSPYPPGSLLYDPERSADLFRKYDYRALLGFYLSHPERLASLVHRGTRSAFHLRPLVLANYAKDSGRPPRTMTTHFDWWSRLRLVLTPVPPFWLALLLGGNLIACALGYRRASRRGRLARQGIAVLVLMAAMEFLVAVLADILGDVARHLYVFHAMCDLLIVGDAAWIAQILRGGRPAAAAAAAAA
ncbi:MAG: hypothetical protein WD451_15740 [Thermoanaerobaculia bacterium]